MSLLKLPLKIFAKFSGKKVGPNLLRKHLAEFYQRYEKVFPPALFLSGFTFDVATVGRIDQWATLIQQAVFLLIIFGILILEGRRLFFDLPLPNWVKKYWTYQESIVHFFFGGLLSAYTIFYFKSASMWNSFIFMFVLLLLLLLNEWNRFQKAGFGIKVLLFSLCITSYFNYVIPILIHRTGLLPFSLGIFLSFGIIFLISWYIVSRTGKWKPTLEYVVGPAVAVQLLFFLFYILKVLPPVPISIQKMGIYHDVTVKNGKYLLSYDRPWYRFWEKGAQTFVAQESDQIYSFARIFSPAGFEDLVYARWLKKNEKMKEWQTSDRIPIEIVGGRAQGFRGYTYKNNYSPGRWQVRFETADSREIGRISFSVIQSFSSKSRIFQLDSD